jgi:hypothetical protein
VSIRQNFINGKGETFTLNLIFEDANNNPVDLTGHTVDLVVSKAGSGTAVGTYPGAVSSEGLIAIAVSDEVTETWPVGKLAYKVVHTTPEGVEKWLVYGALTVISGYDV